MADHFGAIASKEIGSTRAPLVFPQPQPKNGVKLSLNQTHTQPTAVYKKPDTREELDALIVQSGKTYEEVKALLMTSSTTSGCKKK